MTGCPDAAPCLLAWFAGEESQQPTLPHERQSRRWTHLLPSMRQSSHPSGVLGSGVGPSSAAWGQVTAVMGAPRLGDRRLRTYAHPAEGSHVTAAGRAASLASMTTPPPAETTRVSRPSILTVDDDPSVSRAVARDLRRHYGENYRIVRAESGAQALEALREIKLRGEEVAALLADHRMPQMSGIEFLEEAMDLFPQARRVLLTAYADTEAAIQAINVV